MRHFLITRFNDYFPTFDDWSHSTSANPDQGIEEGWLRNRLEIFRTVTVPSVQYQSDPDFTWIIKCHPRTPDWARSILSDGPYIANYDGSPQFSSVDRQASSTFARLIRQITNDKEIITSRVDSDDALSRDYISLVKRHVKPQMFFDFSRGIVRNRWGIFIHYKPKVSQFCSYMESGNEIKTVYHKTHIAIHDSECLKNQVDWGWMQYNHTTNITLSAQFNKEYPYLATAADWPTLKENFPVLHYEWLHPYHLRILI